MKKAYLLIVGILVLGGIFFLARYYFLKQPETEVIVEDECEINKMIFYYANWCSWCNKIKEEKTISKLKQFGVDITEINVDAGPIEHQFTGVPTFVIEGKVSSGYRTFEQLKEMLVCKEL